MIASLRGLAVAAVIAAALVAVAAVDGSRAPAPVNRALVPGFDPARVTELVWERAGQPALRVQRRGDRWELAGEPALPADDSAVAEVLAALRGARWHRAAGATAVRATLTVVAGDARRTLGLGAPLPGSEQSWIVDGDRGLVVDRWVEHALDRDRLALRVKRPLGDVRVADAIDIAGQLDTAIAVRLTGRPRRLVAPVGVLLARPVSEQLDRALDAVEIVRLPDAPLSLEPASGLVIAVAYPARKVRIILGGGCPGAPALVAMSGSGGDGCVEPGVVQAVAHAAAQLQQPATAIAEPRPLAAMPAQITLVDGSAFDVSRDQIDGAAASLDPTRALLRAVVTPGEVVARPAMPAGQHLVLTGPGRVETTLDVLAEPLVARRGEPVALRLAPAAWRALVQRASALRQPTLWQEEPTMVSELMIAASPGGAARVDGVRYRRGAVIGAWTREPAAPFDGHAVDALVAALAAPHPEAASSAAFAASHRVSLTVSPPVGAPVQHTLELGAITGQGCPARVGRDLVALPAMVCMLVAALVQ